MSPPRRLSVPVGTVKGIVENAVAVVVSTTIDVVDGAADVFVVVEEAMRFDSVTPDVDVRPP